MTRFSRRYKATESTFQLIGDLCGPELGALEKRAKMAPWRVAEEWAGVVGPQIAGMTRVVGFDKGILKVCVENSTLLSLLARQEKKRLIEELRVRAPGVTIREILFRLGEI